MLVFISAVLYQILSKGFCSVVNVEFFGIILLIRFICFWRD